MFAYLHIGSPEPRWRKLGVQGRHEGSQRSAVGSPDRSEPCQASRLGGGLGRPDSPAPRSATPPPSPPQASAPAPSRGLGGEGPRRRLEEASRGERAAGLQRESSGTLGGAALRPCGGDAGLGAGGEGAARPPGKRRDRCTAASPAPSSETHRFAAPCVLFFFFLRGIPFPLYCRPSHV